MPDKDLRKMALQSSKTVSRKARSLLSTPGSSMNGSPSISRNGSRAPSRNVSDDEGELSDGTQWSTNSIDELVAPGDPDAPPDAWMKELSDRINRIVDRKRGSVQGTEDSLSVFTLLLMAHVAQQEVRSHMGELVPALLRSVKAGQTERETVLALKALALVLVTDPSDTLYDSFSNAIKATITDAQHDHAKIAGIHALGIVTFYGGASEEETESIMEFFLEIASSDGASVEATDNGDIVTAALEEWGFLATQLDDLEELTEEAMDTFTEQLDSADVNVQIAAGENIALLFEKSYTEAESDDELSEPDSDSDDHKKGPRMVKRYTVYRQQHQLEHQLEELAKASSKRLSKKDRKNLHLNFSDILHTVEKPTRGPRYSTALDEDTGRELGSRLKVNIHGGAKMTIDKWWKLHRLNALKRLLQGGFLVHYELNEVVFDSLPVIIDDD